MTREEAIYELEHMKTWSKDLSDDEIEAIAIALKALNQETILDKIRAEIEEQKKDRCFDDMFEYITGLDDAIYVIDKYRAESEGKNDN